MHARNKLATLIIDHLSLTTSQTRRQRNGIHALTPSRLKGILRLSNDPERRRRVLVALFVGGSSCRVKETEDLHVLAEGYYFPRRSHRRSHPETDPAPGGARSRQVRAGRRPLRSQAGGGSARRHR